MAALVEWVETLRDVWAGFVAEVILDPEAKAQRLAQVALLRHAVANLQHGYLIRKIVIPTEPGIDPADFTQEAFDGALKRFEAGDFDDIMLIGEWPGDPLDFVIISLIWGEAGLFRMETSIPYVKQMSEYEESVEPHVQTVRLALATCGGISGWANIAVADEPEQAEEIARLVAKWRRKSAVTLVDLTPPSHEPQPIAPRMQGACWLTLLSPSDVMAIGGLEALDKALPDDIRFEVSEAGGVLIQLTPTPAPPEDPQVESKYQALSRLLAPLTDAD